MPTDFDADDLNSSGAPQCSKVRSTEGDDEEHEVCICNNSLCNYSNGAEKQELFDARPASSPDKVKYEAIKAKVGTNLAHNGLLRISMRPWN